VKPKRLPGMSRVEITVRFMESKTTPVLNLNKADFDLRGRAGQHPGIALAALQDGVAQEREAQLRHPAPVRLPGDQIQHFLRGGVERGQRGQEDP
jgi:hypothetical protein